MTRRRLITLAAVGISAALAVWSFAIWNQYRNEQQLVGIWQCDGPDLDLTRTNMHLMADGKYVMTVAGAMPVGPPIFWSVRGRELLLDIDCRPLHIAIRPIALLLRLAAPPARVYQFEVTEGSLILFESNGNQIAYTRVTGK